MRTCFRSIAIFGFVSIIWSLQLAGQTPIVELPARYADFAIDPHSGAICCVDHEKNIATLVGPEFLDGMNSELRESIRVGSTPVCVTFKQHGEKRYFVVCCSQDSHLYVIDATEWKAVKKIPVAQAGISWVTNSINPDDPFVYYCFGGGHDSKTGAINLRDMTDCGDAFGDSMDAMISADGKTAYRRGPWSPSGFEALTMTSPMSASKPEFTRLFYDHNSTSQYLPDPFGEFTAAGKTLYKRDLKRSVAKLVGMPVCFLKSKPFLVCTSDTSRSRTSSRSRNSKLQNTRLFCISTNSFKRVGTSLEISNPVEAEKLPRGTGSYSDYKRVNTKRRFLVDDLNERILLADANKIAIIDFSVFDLPDEVPMRIKSLAANLNVGVESTIDLATTHPGIKIEIENMPDRIERVGDQLIWTPSADQVGYTDLEIRLTKGDVERIQKMEFQVSFPGLQLPDTYEHIAASPEGDIAVVWQSFDHRMRNFRGSQNEPQIPRNALSIVSLGDKQIVATKKMPYKISTAMVDKHFLYVASAESDYCEVYDKSTMSKVKTLYASKQISKIDSDDSVLTIDGKSFALPGLTSSGNISVPNELARIRGLDFRTTPKQVSNSSMRDRAPIMNGRHRSHQHGQSPSVNLDFHSAKVQAWHETKTMQVQNAVHTSEQTTEVGLNVISTVTNSNLKRIKLSETKSPIQQGRQTNATQIRACTAKGRVLVLFENRIFIWDTSDLNEEGIPVKLSVGDIEPVVIKGQAKVEFDIDAVGGKGPYEFVQLGGSNEVVVRGNKLVIDAAALQKRAESSIYKEMQNIVSRELASQGANRPQGFSEYQQETRAVATRLFGDGETTLPFKINVKMRVVDSESQKHEFQVPIIVGISQTEFDSRTDAFRVQHKKQLEEHAQRRAQQMKEREAMALQQRGVRSKDGESRKVEALEQRIEILESRIDLLTRQMSELLRSIEGSRAPEGARKR